MALVHIPFLSLQLRLVFRYWLTMAPDGALALKDQTNEWQLWLDVAEKKARPLLRAPFYHPAR